MCHNIDIRRNIRYIVIEDEIHGNVIATKMMTTITIKIRSLDTAEVIEDLTSISINNNKINRIQLQKRVEYPSEKRLTMKDESLEHWYYSPSLGEGNNTLGVG